MSSQTDVARGGAAVPVAGVGASAGGLAPTVELLRELGPRPGLAVVVIHHLDPKHDSGLVDILSRATTLPVEAARDGVCAEADHVYVVPPNAGLLIGGGILKVVARLEDGGRHLPIDRFFESLARDRGALAVGVVLSGTGFDGTEGIKAIKREGGITLAQDGSAQQTGMPDSAIATGCVDFVLPPAELARELARIGASPPRSEAAPPSDQDQKALLSLLAKVRDATGVDFTSYRQPTVRRRVERRIFLRRLSGLGEYLELLEREPAEIRALCEDVLIHVTGFFREPQAFEALEEIVFPALCERTPADAPIRIWVPGCSTGEEVYSIGICLLEHLGRRGRAARPIKIFGTDLSLAAVERARAGRYPASIERDVSAERLQRFFEEDGGVYRIRREVRDLCVFAVHDLTRDPPFSSMDLVSCRNVMIYLSAPLQDRVVALVHYALRESGYLLLGSSETVRAFPGFAAIDGKNKLYARTSAAPRTTFDFTSPGRRSDPGRAAPEPPGRATEPSTSGTAAIHREADRLALAAFAPPGVVVTEDLAVVQFRGATGAFLEPTPGVASLDLLRLAREELRLPLRQALGEARVDGRPVRRAGIELLSGERPRTIDLRVLPFSVAGNQRGFFLVLFEDVDLAAAAPGAPSDLGDPDVGQRPVASRLEQELTSTRHYLESVIEQLEAANEELRAANEEIVSSNEELRSTNEELQSAKEELQAANEELRTVNDEMAERNLQANRLADDLTNVLSSIEIPIVILGPDARLRRFTPAAGALFGLCAADVGKVLPLAGPMLALTPTITAMIGEVLAHLQMTECSVQDGSGRWYQLAVRPYVTLDRRIDGTVVTALDVHAARTSHERLAHAQQLAEDIVDLVPEPLVVLARDLTLRSWNKAFLRVFGLGAAELQGKRLDQLGCPELSDPMLVRRLETVGDGRVLERFRIEGSTPEGARRVISAHAHGIGGTELVLLAFDDISGVVRAERAAERAEGRLRDILQHALSAIVMCDELDRIVFANSAAAAVFGYDPDELLGLPLEDLLPDVAAPPRVLEREGIARRKDGSEVPVEVVLSPSRQSAGTGLVVFVTDITERLEAEQRIRDYQQRLREMEHERALTEERERRRIAVELHDRIGQSLALAQIKLTALRGAASEPERAALDEVVGLVEGSAAETRTLTFDLSPPILYDLGLGEALSWLAEDIERRYGLPIELDDDGEDKRLESTAGALVFRAVRELLMNVLKHAHAAGAKLTLRRVGDQLDITVEDSGTGFEVLASPGQTGGSFGLLSVREQIRGLGGSFDLVSEQSAGTRVHMRVPLLDAARHEAGS